MSKPAAARANVRGDRNIVVQANGSGINVTVNERVPHLRLTDFAERTARASDGSDAALLSAYRTDVVPLLGRAHALEDLWLWLASGRDVSVRVLTGGAGRGKTRLALELVRDVAGRGWVAGFVEQRDLDRFRGQQNVAEWAWDKPVLIVVDYAASRADPLREWIGELVDAPARRPPLRLLLLERQAQREIGWLATVAGHGHDDRSRAAASLLDPPEPAELAAIDELPSRRQIFATLLARKRAGLVPPEAGADAEFDRLLRHEKWSGDPLFLMMAGLVAGAHGINDALTLSRTDLAAIIARRELDRIGAIAAGAGIDAGNRRHPGFLARHAAVLATLCQGLTVEDARALIEAEAGRLKSAADINTAVAALRDGLPATGDGPEIAPILPDIVGEAAILLWFGEGGVLLGLGIDSLASIRGVANTALARTSQVLVRTAQDFAAGGRDEPVRWLYAIAQAAEADLGAVMTIADALPHQTLAMRELAAELSQSIVDRLRSNVLAGHATEATLSGWLGNFGNRLSDLGRREEALAASQEAVAIYRRLAETRPDAFLPDLARSLNNVGAMLSNLGRREEALAASEEAVAIYRRLAETRPDAFLPDLAQSLNNVSVDLSNLGRREEALAASQEAVAIYRRLAETRPDAFLPDLARSLNNLGVHLSSLGRREEALAASQEAVAIYRRLAETRPDAFLPDLALSLTGLGVHLSNLGRREEALAASQEAVAIYRRLAETRPDAFLPDLARSLNNLGLGLSDLGRREEALAASQEAVAIYRRLAETRPDAFLPDLAMSLNNLGVYLSNLGRREEALAASQEAVDIWRRLAQTRPDAFLPDLARSLNNLGLGLSNLGRREEALAASQEAVALYRRLAQTRPDAFLPDLARSLNNLGLGLSNLGRREEALAASQEAVDIWRRLAETRPDAFLPDLAQSLNNVSVDLSNLGRREEALAASQEAVAIRRRLAETRPDVFLPDLAASLNNLSGDLSNLGRREEALAASQEAVAIRRRHAETRPDVFLPDLSRSISVMSDVLAALDRHGEAAQAATQALGILAPFVERYPQTYRGLARTMAADVVRYCEAAGQPPDNALLARAARALGDDPPAEAAASEALQAETDAILDAARKTGALDEGALAGLPPEFVAQVRAAWAAAQARAGGEKTGG